MSIPFPEMPILKFDGADAGTFLAKHIKRNEQDHAAAREIAERIVEDVRKNGDAALLSYIEQFDGARLSPAGLRVGPEETEAAYQSVSAEFVEVIRRAIIRIRRFHEKQNRTGWMEPFGDGEFMGQMVRPLASCGIYVPGGTAALASSVLMQAVPAKVAGVGRLVIATPCGKDGKVNPAILVAAAECGIDEIYKIGGAQAIAALAFGTERIPRVDKICGPGNIYVIMAKRAVFGYVGIDSLPGPSEIVIIADETADPRHAAADMLSQAEHDVRAASVLITDSESLAQKVRAEIEKQTETLSRREIICGSLKNNGLIIVAPSLYDAVRLSDVLAPEHLALEVKEPLALLTRVKNAGAVFLGHYTAEPMGDYMAGPSHVLPTETTARFFSPVSADDFLKKTSVLYFDKPAMERLKPDVIRFAGEEKLTAHANAMGVRD
ncbi:MAG: histidinol dehydrogenase [Clostridiales bacterium]|jgi:histidinol dehydrogenase|nr:histidinol dehydrogenase [Clostridiales bacterium]